jgi:hypothetical protein
MKDLDISKLPVLPMDARPRRIYVREMNVEEEHELRDRGYDPVGLFALPRRDDAENITYLLAKTQAIEEGTIIASAEERKQLALGMQVFGMLNPKSTRLNLNLNLDSTDIDELLNWQRSRHTLRENTTVVGMDARMAVQDAAMKKVEEARRTAEKKVLMLAPTGEKVHGRKRALTIPQKRGLHKEGKWNK